MSLARISLRQSVVMHIVFIGAMAAGVFSLSKMQVDVFPNVSMAQAKITTTWLGASPEDVEQFITRKIEEEIDEIQGIDRIVSYSQRDMSLVDVKFLETLSESDYRKAYGDLRAALERVTELPDEAEEPLLQEQTVNEVYPLIQVNVTSPGFVASMKSDPEESDRHELILRAVLKELRQELQNIPGVLRVSDQSIRDREYRVDLDAKKLAHFKLTVLDVYNLLKANHLNLPAGPISRDGQEKTVRLIGEFANPEEILAMEISGLASGSQESIRLGDIATVRTGFERRSFISRFNGERCLSVGVFKNDSADSITLKEEIDAVIEKFRERTLPKGVKIRTAIDTTQVIENRLSVLRDSLLFGITLVFFILWLFVGMRNSLLAIIGVPFSFLTAMIFLEPMGITINGISLFSMVLVSGMIVDDAIIVIENIYRHVEKGKPIHRAIIDGSRQVTMPVVAATLTTLGAFLPLLLMEGVTGVFLSYIPKTVIPCLLASVVECFLILPAHYLSWGPSKPADRKFDRAFERFKSSFGRVLGRTIPFHKSIILLCLCLVILAGGLSKHIPKELYPSDFGAFFVNITMPPEYSLEQTEAAAAEIEDILDEYLDQGRIKAHSSSIGITWTTDNQLLIRPNVSQTLVSLTDEMARSSGPEDLINEVRQKVDDYIKSKRSQHEFVQVETDAFQDGPPTGKPIAIRIRGNDFAASKALALELRQSLTQQAGVTGISDNLQVGSPEIRILPRRDQLADFGLTFEALALTARGVNDGLIAGRLKAEDSDDEIEIRVNYEKHNGLGEESERAITDASLRTPSGAIVELNQVAEIQAVQDYQTRYHYNGDRTVMVTADLDTALNTSTAVNEQIRREFANVADKHPGTSLYFGGEFEETQRSYDSLAQALGIAILLIYCVLAAQFRSYILPFVVLSAVPLAFVGVVLGLLILGYPFTILTFVAIVGLAGIAVNDSLVLVEFIEKSVLSGMDPMKAAIHGALQRLRAIILTTATTVIGLLPMALELTGSSKIWSPFAATISSGLIIASTLTLFFVPSVYLLTLKFRPAPQSADFLDKVD